MDKINLDDYEEISEEEYFKPAVNKDWAYFVDGKKVTYFKKKSKDVFEEFNKEFDSLMEYCKNNIEARDRLRRIKNLLEQAIEEARRRRNGK